MQEFQQLTIREGTAEERILCRPLFLLADESDAMLARYLDRARLIVAAEGDTVVATALVTDEGDGVAEIKNLAVVPQRQRSGLGRRMVEAVRAHCRGTFRTLRVGTGAGTPTVRFYEKCGFREVGRIPGFFTANYPEPIWEAGVRLVDMAVLEQLVEPLEPFEPTEAGSRASSASSDSPEQP